MPKQRIVIDIDTRDKPPYDGVEGDDYHALEDFFQGLDFTVEHISYGEGVPPHVCPAVQ